ncbi:hypothetical protein JOQ06_026272 [Pogonophryne albipinna]|uniref:Uncharacterized protein n=1 Tax=Pogonophryne albipinna TaxID=1090488 RepID=A0AAD6AAT0_9TELE|nr:hypothetical protein JOQ06_026272 [Pogonophryne albipinna]
MSEAVWKVFCPTQREQHGAEEDVSAARHRVPRVLFVTNGDSSVTSQTTYTDGNTAFTNPEPDAAGIGKNRAPMGL